MASNEDIEFGEPPDDSGKDDVSADADFPDIAKIVNAVLLSAVRMNASDIHLEPYAAPAEKDSKVLLRFRVDGVLTPAPLEIPWNLRNAVMAKLKILGWLDIAERRVPQTGRIRLRFKGRALELRLSVMPTVHGEACVMSVIDDSKDLPGVMDLGFLPDTRDRFLALFDNLGGGKNAGLVLVCGLADSGKKTALYAVLNRIKDPGVKIVTAECPVRRALDGVVQIHVNPVVSVEGGRRFDYSTALRHMRRFDPDVVMTGELGDAETAGLVVETAESCLALAALHVRNAEAALVRLADMGLPPFKTAAALKGVLALRLARRLCEQCKTAREPGPAEKAAFEKNGTDLPSGSRIFGPPKDGGCAECGGRGFKGRIGLHELLVVDETVRAALLKDGAPEAARAAFRQKGTRRFAQDGLEKVKLGLTTMGEALGGLDED